jgi:hypothetical protein
VNGVQRKMATLQLAEGASNEGFEGFGREGVGIFYILEKLISSV